MYAEDKLNSKLLSLLHKVIKILLITALVNILNFKKLLILREKKYFLPNKVISHLENNLIVKHCISNRMTVFCMK